MKWSQHRKQIREMVCPELRERIDFHVTCYRHAHDDVGEAWITVDGEKVFGAGHYKWWEAYYKARKAIREEPVEREVVIGSMRHPLVVTAFPKTVKRVFDQGNYETGHFLKATHDYLNMSLDDALRSDNHLIRALAMVDRRLGKRRFFKIAISSNEPAFVKFFYFLRQEVMNKDIQAAHVAD